MYAIWNITNQLYYNGLYSGGVVDTRDIEPMFLFETAEAAETYIERKIGDRFDAEVAELDYWKGQ